MRRELNEIEYFNWCVGQPYNMVAEIRIRGEVTAERLRTALQKAQRRHPLLRVNTEPGPAGVPWFSSDGVGELPLTVVEGATDDDVRRLTESELRSRFEMEVAGAARPPLLRVAVLHPRTPGEPSWIVLTVQHVIADGLSLLFLVRDLVHFMAEPDAPVEVLEAPASDADLLPPKVRRTIPRTALRFRIASFFLTAWAKLVAPERTDVTSRHGHHHRTWELTAEETARLVARCRAEKVSVQAAICTAFLSLFPGVHTPVSLRPMLAREVGESVGLFVGAAVVKLKYREREGFWVNARRFKTRLRREMRDPFFVFRLCSKAVRAADIQRLGSHLVALTAGDRPFAVTNLGRLDASMLQAGDLKVESFYGAVTGIVDSSVLTVYTIEDRLRLHLLANENGPTPTTIREGAEAAVHRLKAAVG